MAARKLQQEVDKCFKKVDEGVADFESIHEKIEQSTNAAQKEKLEDNLKKEIKKLQRLRDQIKTWAANNDIKDKGPLLDKRKLIETQMEKFKLVEKAMKTKAYSKEGLSAATKLDPKDQAKADACEFLNEMVSRLDDQIQTLEAESQGIQATMKRGKNTSKLDRLAEIEKRSDLHKWHQGKLELIKRSLENGVVDVEEVTAIQDDISYYVDDNMKADFAEDDELYDGLNLKEEEDTFGMYNDNDRVSSQDAQSVQDEAPEQERSNSVPNGKPKPASTVDAPGPSTRRPSTQLKSPAPALATLHTPLSNITNIPPTMKPAAMPIRAPGETLKYASAAAAAAASEKNGIAPLPPPPEALPPPNTSTNHPPLPSFGRRPSLAAPSPKPAHSQLSSVTQTPTTRFSAPVPAPEIPSNSQAKSPALSHSSTAAGGSSLPQAVADKVENAQPITSRGPSGKSPATVDVVESPKVAPSRPNGVTNGTQHETAEDTQESIYHLPPGMQDLVEAFEKSQQRVSSSTSQASSRMLDMSLKSAPRMQDLSAPRSYKPENRYVTPSYYPQELDTVFDDPGLYSRIDPDTLFYVFYYKQGTYQQYLAAKALKDQSWRFHKQYQTWFQRHEEPKNITEEYEQGTYRFFDYESTWMNRRKADFKFAYKFLEDVV